MKKTETLAEKTARLKALREEKERSALVVQRSERAAHNGNVVGSNPARRTNFPILGLDDELPFGKHLGKPLREVIEQDPGWIEWAMDHIVTFEISKEAEDELAVVRDVRRPPKAWE